MKGGNGKGKAKGKNKHKNKGPKCKNKHGKGCPKQTAHCPSYSATPHDDGTTTITVDYSCLKGGSIGYVVVDEGCDGHCDGNMKNVRSRMPGAVSTSVKQHAYPCTPRLIQQCACCCS